MIVFYFLPYAFHLKNMSPFEIGMLVCFGASWPLSILKLWRTKRSDGKSRLFLAIVILGYVCGVLHKIFYNFDLVVLLYVLNLAMVALDLHLTNLYRKRNKEPRT